MNYSTVSTLTSGFLGAEKKRNVRMLINKQYKCTNVVRRLMSFCLLIKNYLYFPNLMLNVKTHMFYKNRKVDFSI